MTKIVRYLIMKFTARGEYGIRAMAFLALREKEAPVSLQKMSQADRLPITFLAQIMSALRKARLVDSVRGSHGGYLLSRPAAQIKVGEILRALKEDTSFLHCLKEKERCERTESCPSRSFWGRAKKSLDSLMEETTLADLILRPFEGGSE